MGLGGHHDEELRRQVGQFDFRFFCQRMIDRNGDQHRILRDAFGAHFLVGERGAQTDEPEIDFAIVKRLELFGTAHIEEVQCHVWREFAKGSQRGRQQPVMKVRDVANIELRSFPAIHPLHGRHTFGAQRKQFFGVGKKETAFVGQRDSVVGSIQQAHADFLLQVSHLSRQRRLSEAELLGGFGKA
jgi:hypothetical protein